MIFLGFIIGFVIGMYGREIYNLEKRIKLLSDKMKPKTNPQITPGAYIAASEGRNTPHVINPKSPQLMEWEANERTRQENIVERNVKPQ